MAECVTLNTDGTLTPTGQTVGQCTGFVLVSGSEYGVYQMVQDVFCIPQVSDVTGWFCGAWGCVVFFYVMSRCVGAVARVFR